MTHLENEIEWDIFEIGEVFKIERGQRHPLSDHSLGHIPYYSALSSNNGLAHFLGNPLFTNRDKLIVTTFCDAYYVEGLFTASDEITMLDNKNLNKYNGLFISNIIKSNSHTYGFGRKAFSYRIQKQKILLPIKKDGSPDWQYMEHYIENQEVESVKKSIEFLKDDLLTLGDFQQVSLDNVDWETFSIESILDIYNGVRLTSADMDEGIRPFIGATEYNNGITNYVSNTNKSLDSNVLGINYNGSVCEGFYHQYEAVFSDDVKRLKFKNGVNNEYTLHFLLTSVEKQRTKYQYGYKFNTTRMKNQKIILPATADGQPDFEFMENYIKGIKYDSITKAINFIKNKK